MLTLIVFLPVLGALFCMIVPKRHVRTVAVASALAAFLVSLSLFGIFFGEDDTSEAIFGSQYGTLHHVERTTWMTIDGRDADGNTGERFTIEYFLGIDGLGFPLLILTTFVAFLACLASWNFDRWSINKGVRAYFILFLLL